MFKSKLGLKKEKIDRARGLAKDIAVDVQKFVDSYSTVSVERTICRLFGIDGVNIDEVPLPNIVVQHLNDKGVLSEGVMYFIGNAVLELGLTPQEIAEKVSLGELDLTKIKHHAKDDVRKCIEKIVDSSIDRIEKNKNKRDEYLNTIGEGPKPYLYVIVATGNIYEDVIQAQAAARQGADIIAVIRTTGQSLLDYVPYGATTEGFGGTFATQENFRIMRTALDEVGEEVGRYIR
ncbi:MAG: lysine 5,6-aminomutase subunit alpha TIM-barrel domain-containing protein, partial [Cetobacterium sp.]